jgi:hypothetical protein
LKLHVAHSSENTRLHLWGVSFLPAIFLFPEADREVAEKAPFHCQIDDVAAWIAMLATWQGGVKMAANTEAFSATSRSASGTIMACQLPFML